jgi:hypothetical protein
LNSEVFLVAWQSWNTHRHETKKKLSPLAAEMQLRKLAEMGVERAVAAINHSIMNGYQGIFEPKPDFAPQRPVRGGAPRVQAPVAPGGPVTIEQWREHYAAVLAKGFVPFPDSNNYAEQSGYQEAVNAMVAARKAAAAVGGGK